MVTLIIMDGLGTTNTIEGNAVAAAKTPNLDSYRTKYPYTTLGASGLAVGLPDDSVQGNSEVGHLNIGAGRVVYQDLTLINKSLEEGDFFEKTAFLEAIEHCKKNNSALHLCGMITDEGVHSHSRHLFALLELAKRHDFERVFIHAFLDGRDVPPQSAKKYISELQQKIEEIGVGKIATMIGRSFAMDRDKTWSKTELAYNLMVHADGRKYSDPYQAVDDAYAEGVNIDEHIRPVVIAENDEPIARVQSGDSVIHFNFRKDRVRQLYHAFCNPSFEEFNRGNMLDIFFVTMTDFDPALRTHIAFPQQVLVNHLGEYLSKLGKTNLRVAETEKFAHITYFFNALCDVQYEGEDRILINSIKVEKNFNEAPAMSALEIRDTAIESIKSGKYDAVFINFANCDLVGHSGVFEAARTAAETVDICVDDVVRVTLEMGGVAIVTADHGNAEQMIYPGTTTVCTSHTTNPVPFFIIGANNVHQLRADGVLGDIAPTVLDLMGIEKPAEMTGKTLISN